MSELLILDWVIIGAAIFFALSGLFRGFSGELGSAVGWAALAAAAYFGWDYFGEKLTEKWMAAIATGVLALMSFWLARIIISKVVNCALSQPTDAIVGFLLGILKVAAAAFALVYFQLGLEYSVILSLANRFV